MSRSLGAVAGGGEDQQSGPGAVSFQHCRSRGMARGGGSTLHISVGGEMMLQTVQHTMRQKAEGIQARYPLWPVLGPPMAGIESDHSALAVKIPAVTSAAQQ